MVQGVNKEYIFNSDDYIEKYLDIINENKKNYNFTIIAYCIMNNHAHFLIYVEDIQELGKFMHKCNLLYAQLYNKERNRVGVLFRNRYQTEPIYDINYLINCIKYIHDNPVKAKMVSKCEDYKYSSYKDYIYNKGVTKTKIMIDTFGKRCDYLQLFERSFNKRFMDISDENSSSKEYILEGIREYRKKNSKKTYEILSNRNLFKELILFLNEICGIRYVEIKAFFEIPRGTMNELKKQ